MDNNFNKNKALSQKLLPFLYADNQDKNPNRIPPLEKWQPSHSSPLDITIQDNSEWWHEGAKMTRQSLVNLFARVLWAEYDEFGNKIHYLKTPTDKYQIQVVDAPLFINRVDVVLENDVQWLQFGTTTGDTLRLDDTHSLYFAAFGNQERLYMTARFHLVARVLNNVLFHLVEMGELIEHTDDVGTTKTVLKLSSGGKIYSLISL